MCLASLVPGMCHPGLSTPNAGWDKPLGTDRGAWWRWSSSGRTASPEVRVKLLAEGEVSGVHPPELLQAALKVYANRGWKVDLEVAFRGRRRWPSKWHLACRLTDSSALPVFSRNLGTKLNQNLAFSP